MRNKVFSPWLICSGLLINGLLFSNVSGEESSGEKKASDAVDQAGIEALKPQTVCPLTGGGINKEAYTDYKGERIYFCCMGCEPRFWKNPEKSLQKMKENGEMSETLDPVKVQPKCPVNGETIDPAIYTDHNGKRFFFCCEKCRKKFTKNPEKFIKKMEGNK